ncbi:MAG: hypothetical protein JXR07_16350 [Reichenbachiella sp.]
MSFPFYKNFLLTLISIGLLNHLSFSQAYSLKITKSTIVIDTLSLAGYETNFTQSYEEVKKGWWKYIKGKAHIENYFTHYELKIPDSDRNANKPLFLVSKLTGSDSIQFRTLSLGLRIHNLGEDQIPTIDAEVKNMLLEFKTDFFVSKVENEIKAQEKRSRKLSTQLEKLRKDKKREEMDSVSLAAKEKGILLGLKQIDENLDRLKIQLQEIK